MSNDTHDQNKGLETLDTAPSRMRVIAYALLGYLLVACVGYFFLYGIDVSDETNAAIEGADVVATSAFGENTGSFPPAAYLINAENVNLIPAQIQLGNIHSASDREGLATVLGTFPRVRIIFIDESVLSNEDQVILIQEQFEAGKMIVAFRTTHEKLSQALGLSSELPDLAQDEKANSVIWVSGWYTDDDGNPAEISQGWEQFPTMMTTPHILARTPQ